MLHNPIFRWGVGLSGAVVVAAVSYFFLTGTVQLVAYGIAAFDGVMTPLVLKRAAAE
ncbi:hypothetical protein [Halonotius pteroides]|jgi:hypothetical protein|uniref:hypothetical protein n=1 Tax=Halonotius pteroides TaxID=268735 RepID=UPI0014024375|nr:hypothetical protein [Halonotius pteroides]